MASGGTPESRHFGLHKLAEGIYAAIAAEGGWAICNAGIIDLGDETLVFDTFVNQGAAADLRMAAERLTGRAPSIVLNSHWHSDHVKGNQVFTGARVISTEKTREVMTEMRRRWMDKEGIRRLVEAEFSSIPEGPERVLYEGYRDGHLDSIPTLNYTLPDETFEDRMVFHGERRSAEAITYGGGHTVSDSLLYLPEEGTAFLGDLLFIDSQPYLADGDPENLLRILDKVEALGAKTLVPGHGPVGTSKDIAPIREYVNMLQKTVDKIRGSGGGVPEALEVPLDPPFDGWKWHSFYKDNLEFLFQRKEKQS